jgi:putative endonuclease
MKSEKEAPKVFGDYAESRAVTFLKREGFVIIKQNYFAKKIGEIDIIASKAGTLHFIEVKGSQGSFDPVYNITPKKLHKVIRSATYYMQRHKLQNPFCIDALLVRSQEIEFIENITL